MPNRITLKFKQTNMQQSTQTKQRDILNMSTGTEETHNKNSSLIERFMIPETPFTVWSDYRGEKEIHYLTMGNYKVSEDCETQKEAREWPQNHMWELITTMIVIVGEKAQEIKNLKEEYKEIPQG